MEVEINIAMSLMMTIALVNAKKWKRRKAETKKNIDIEKGRMI